MNNLIAFEDATETEHGWQFKAIIGPFPTREEADAAALLLSLQFRPESEVNPAPLGIDVSDGIETGDKVS